MCFVLTGCTLYSNGEDFVVDGYDIKDVESAEVETYAYVDKNGVPIAKYNSSSANYDANDTSADAAYDASYDKVPVICLDYGAGKDECLNPKYLPITPNTKVSSYRIGLDGNFNTSDVTRVSGEVYPAALKDGLTWASDKKNIESFLRYLDKDPRLIEVQKDPNTNASYTALERFKQNHIFPWFDTMGSSSGNISTLTDMYVSAQEKGGKSSDGQYECVLLYNFITELGKKLEEKGYSVVYTRNSGNKTSAVPVDERATQINNSDATLCISFSMCRKSIAQNSIGTKIVTVAPEYQASNDTIAKAQIYAQTLNLLICNQDSTATGTSSNEFAFKILGSNTKGYGTEDDYKSFVKVGNFTLPAPIKNCDYSIKEGKTKKNGHVRVTTTKADPLLYYVTQVPTFEIMLGDIRDSNMVKNVGEKDSALINGCIEGISLCAPLSSDNSTANATNSSNQTGTSQTNSNQTGGNQSSGNQTSN